MKLTNEQIRELWQYVIQQSQVYRKNYMIDESPENIDLVQAPMWFVGLCDKMSQMCSESSAVETIQEPTTVQAPTSQVLPFHSMPSMPYFTKIYLDCMGIVAELMRDNNYFEGPPDQQDVRRHGLILADATWRDASRYLRDGWFTRPDFDVDEFFGAFKGLVEDVSDDSDNLDVQEV